MVRIFDEQHKTSLRVTICIHWFSVERNALVYANNTSRLCLIKIATTLRATTPKATLCIQL